MRPRSQNDQVGCMMEEGGWRGETKSSSRITESCVETSEGNTSAPGLRGSGGWDCCVRRLDNARVLARTLGDLQLAWVVNSRNSDGQACGFVFKVLSLSLIIAHARDGCTTEQGEEKNTSLEGMCGDTAGRARIARTADPFSSDHGFRTSVQIGMNVHIIQSSGRL